MSTAALAAPLRLLGWGWAAGIILGMSISVASNVVMAMVLGERHDAVREHLYDTWAEG